MLPPQLLISLETARGYFWAIKGPRMYCLRRSVEGGDLEQEKNTEIASYTQQSKAKQEELESQFAAQVIPCACKVSSAEHY